MLDQDQMLMQTAFKQAALAFEKDEVPVGAVIVHQSTIIAKSHNQVEILRDPTAHAEMIAITQATNTLGSKWLQECCLYVTVEPCAMCAGALVLSRIQRICFGASDPKAGACGSVMNIARHSSLNHEIEVVGGILSEECGSLMSQFFQNKRSVEKKQERLSKK